nr:hypothetical protein [Tanacetum cinerariifolium]
MEKTRNKPKELLPYGMLFTRLFKHVVSVFPELAIDHYLSHDQVMHPFAPHYDRKTRSDHCKKIPHESYVSSSSTTLNHPFSSGLLDDTIDVNDEESFHSNSSSPSQNVSSSSNVVPRAHKNHPHESHNVNSYLSKTINLQNQQRDAHREGLRGKKKRLVTHGLEGYEFKKACNNDKNLSEIQLEHEKEDELVAVVVKVVHELDCVMVVKDIESGLLEEVKKSWNGGLSKTLMMKERRMKKVKVVVKYKNCVI